MNVLYGPVWSRTVPVQVLYSTVIKSIIKDAGIPDIAAVTEARGLRSYDASRPGDVVVLDFFRDGQHLVLDVVVTIVDRNIVLL